MIFHIQVLAACAAFAAITSAVPSLPASSVAPTPPLATATIGEDTYKYISLVGKSLFPSDARDKFGDTMGGLGFFNCR